MKSPQAADLLRSITFHSQPLALARVRPRSSPLEAKPLASPQRDARHSGKAAAPPRAEGYEEGFARGREEGRRVGFETGLAEAGVRSSEAIESARAALQADATLREKEREATWSEVLNSLDDLRRKFEAAAGSCLERLERDSATLAFEAVCRMVGESSGQAEHVARCVRTAMQGLRGARLLRIRMRPDDLDRLSLSPEGEALTRQSESVEWVRDPGVSSGGCIFDTELGSVDARMEVQLAGLRQAWAEASRRAESASAARALQP